MPFQGMTLEGGPPQAVDEVPQAVDEVPADSCNFPAFRYNQSERTGRRALRKGHGMYIPDEKRYERIPYRRCGASGVLLPALSLGLWHNFGSITPFGVQQSILRTAFDNGITHFDLANNYGPPYGEAERNFGVHMDRDWRPHRDELIISTKAGYDMWPGPYGDHGSRKYLIASLDQSLARMHLDYVDLFYTTAPTRTRPWRRRWARWTPSCAAGARSTSASPTTARRRLGEVIPP